MTRLWSLFEKRGFRYHRITKQAYTLSTARVIFQDSLLAPALGGSEYSRSLRPVDDSWAGQQRVYRPPVERETQGVDGIPPGTARAATFVREKLKRTEGPGKPEIVPERPGSWRSGQKSGDE